MRAPTRFFVSVVAVGLVLSGCSSGGGAGSSKGGRVTGAAIIKTGDGESYVPTGKLIADSGFRPATDGFSFPNYGNDPGVTNLTPADVQYIFGDVACAYVDGDTCILTPPAQQWMDQQNAGMNGGHCNGFSVASLEFFKQEDDPNNYGAATTNALQFDGNVDVQRELASTFVYQTFDSVRKASIEGPPSAILDALIANLSDKNAEESYTMGIYQPDFSGGHAITPFAVEDKGDGLYAVLVYDNNYPNSTRAVLIDKTNEQWSYHSATNPNEPDSDYVGDASTQTLDLSPTTPGLDIQPCPFCDGSIPAGGTKGSKSRGSVSTTNDYNEVIMTSGNPVDHGHIVITADDGKQSGFVGGKFINDIPGVIVERPKMDTWKQSLEPSYKVPVALEPVITIDGSTLQAADTTSISMIGPGYEVAVEGINLDPGQMDQLVLAADGTTLSYKTDSNESPLLDVGIQGATADYEMLAQGVDLNGGGLLTMDLEKKDEIVVLDTTGTKNTGTYGLEIHRIDDNGEEVFTHDNIELQPGDNASIVFGKWARNGAKVPLIVAGPGGKDAATYYLTDQNQ